MAAKIKKGDKVVVLTGKDKGKTGEVLQVIPEESRALVQGINLVRRHTKQTASQDSVTATTDGVDAQGKPLHTDITYKFDGKEYEYKGAPDPKTTRIYTRISDNTYQWVSKVDGRITTTSRVSVAADGKTRTIVTTGRDAQGRAINNVTSWDKQ